jgi:hypothetical protein
MNVDENINKTLQGFKMKKFKEYFMNFYGPEGIYPKTFENGFTDKQFKLAYDLRIESGHYSDGDSFDREAIRDTILCSISPMF